MRIGNIFIVLWGLLLLTNTQFIYAAVELVCPSSMELKAGLGPAGEWEYDEDDNKIVYMQGRRWELTHVEFETSVISVAWDRPPNSIQVVCSQRSVAHGVPRAVTHLDVKGADSCTVGVDNSKTSHKGSGWVKVRCSGSSCKVIC